MTAPSTTFRRTAALMSVAASFALPAAASAKDAPASMYHPPRDNHAQASPTSGNDGVDGLAVAVSAGVLALTIGGVAFSVRRTSLERRDVSFN